MTQSLSLIHPEAPEFLSAAALYSAPIDVEAAVARIRELWNEDIDLVWEEMPIEGNGAGGGDILRFRPRRRSRARHTGFRRPAA